MLKSEDIPKKVTEWAEGEDNVRAVILTSSRANPNADVDILSDYDIVLYVRDTDLVSDRDALMAEFGEVMVRHPVWDMVYYKGGSRIDFSVESMEDLRKEVEDPDPDEPFTFDEGYRILLDKDGMTEGLRPPTYMVHFTEPPTEDYFLERVSRFWFNITYIAKGLYRDQLFYAKQALDGHLHHSYLSETLAWHAGMKNGWKSNPGSLGKNLKKLTDAEIWTEVEKTFAGVDPEENWEAMFNLGRLYGKLMSEIGDHLGYAYPSETDHEVTAYLRSIHRELDAKS